ncbi:MAG: hypothetical protein Q8O59_01380 [bacterium]|nr:hypothetical protein [bacterium]
MESWKPEDIKRHVESTKEVDGISHDFFNEVPWSETFLQSPHLEKWMERFASGEAKTYTQRFVDKGLQEVLDISNPVKVEELDRLMTEAMEISKNGDKKLFKEKIREIWSKK